MRTHVARWLVVLILAVIVGAHLAEVVDRWDDTLKTGRDIESSLTVIAACAGVVFIAAPCVRLLLGARDARCEAIAEQPSLLAAIIAEIPSPCVSPPPALPLRI